MLVDNCFPRPNPCRVKGFILCSLILGLSGCILIPEEHESHHNQSVPLSEAMEASASGSQEPLPRPRPSESSVVVVPAVGEESVAASGGSGDDTMVDYGDTSYRWQAPLERWNCP